MFGIDSKAMNELIECSLFPNLESKNKLIVLEKPEITDYVGDLIKGRRGVESLRFTNSGIVELRMHNGEVVVVTSTLNFRDNYNEISIRGMRFSSVEFVKN